MQELISLLRYIRHLLVQAQNSKVSSSKPPRLINYQRPCASISPSSSNATTACDLNSTENPATKLNYDSHIAQHSSQSCLRSTERGAAKTLPSPPSSNIATTRTAAVNGPPEHFIICSTTSSLKMYDDGEIEKLFFPRSRP